MLTFIPRTGWVYILVNQNVIDLFGTSIENIIGNEDKEFFDLALSDELLFNDSRVIELGQAIKREERNVIKTNTIFWTIKSPMYNDQGQIIGEFGISIDITERKLAEDM